VLEQRGGAGHRADDELRAEVGGNPVAHAGVDLGLGHERHVGRRRRHQAGRGLHLGLGDRHDRAEAPEELEHAVGVGAVAVGVVGVDGHAGADLDRRARQHPRDRDAVAVRRLDPGDRDAAEDRDHRLRAAAHLLGDFLELRGLVAEDDQIGAVGERAVALDRLPAGLGRQLLRALGEDVGAQDGLAPSARQRAGHVPRSDKADHPVGQSTDRAGASLRTG
jgi:hypothetical protein